MKKSVLVIFSLIIMISIILSGCFDNEGMAGSVFNDAPEGTVAVVEVGEDVTFFQSFDAALKLANDKADSDVTLTLLSSVNVTKQITPEQRSKSLTFDLGGFTIDRGLSESTSDGSVFGFTSSGDFTVKNGTVTGGNNTSAGGGIYAGSNDIKLTLEDLTVSGNHSKQGGGGIYLDKNNMTVNLNSITVNGNSTDGYGGGMYMGFYKVADFDCLSVNFNSVTVIDGNEGKDDRNNLTIGTDYSNIYNIFDYSFTDFTGLSTGANIKLAFDEFYSGLIKEVNEEIAEYLHSDTETLTLECNGTKGYFLKKHEHNYVAKLCEGFTGLFTCGCTVEDCPCQDAEVYMTMGPVTVADGTPKPVTLRSSVSGVNMEDYLVYTKKGESVPLNGAPSEPGDYTASITFGGVTISVDYSIIPQQEPHIHDGIEYLPVTSEYYLISDGKNYLTLPTGHYYLMDDLKNTAIWLDGDDVTLCLNGHIIYGEGNESQSYFPILVNDKQSLNICNCKLETIHCFNVSGNSDSTVWTLSDDTQGAVDISTLLEEPAAGDKVFFKGGGICNNYAWTANSGKLNLSDIKYVHNFAEISSTYDDSNNLAELNIDNCLFMFNHGAKAGAIDSMGKLNIKNSEFTANANSSDDTLGGAIAACKETTIDNCNFYNNSSWCAGAIYIKGSTKISNCEFAYNYGTECGGALYCAKKCDIISTTIRDNISNNYGGGIYAFTGNVNISDCTISDNISSLGGGMCFTNASEANIKNTKIIKNMAILGAGIRTSGELLIEDCEITENRMFTKKDLETVFPEALIEELTDEDNYDGEGIYWHGGSLTLSGKVTIYNNRLNNSAPNKNLFIDNDDLPNALIKIGPSGISAGSKIGISLYNYPSSGSKTKISDNGDYYDCFVSDASGYKVGMIGNGLYLADKDTAMDSDIKDSYNLQVKNFKTGNVETINIKHGGTLIVNPVGGLWKGSGDTQVITVKGYVTVPNPVMEGKHFDGWKIVTRGSDIVGLTALWS